jgi:hypothetical protein
MSEAGNIFDYLQNLDKWQASSHPSLAESKPEELFETDFVERYSRLHSDLWGRMIRVHGTLYTLKQLKDFPFFDYIYSPQQMEFWRLVFENFFDMACLMLHGLVCDQGKDVHTLRSFRDQIMKASWLFPDKQELFKQILKERKFDETVQLIEKRVEKIRDNYVAHRLINKESGTPKEALTGVSLEELQQLFQAVHSLFGALSFGATYVTLTGDLMPGTIGGQPKRTCLDDVLDAVLRDSPVVREPEIRAQWWPELRKHMPPEELRRLNGARKRIGLPEA